MLTNFHNFWQTCVHDRYRKFATSCIVTHLTYSLCYAKTYKTVCLLLINMGRLSPWTHGASWPLPVHPFPSSPLPSQIFHLFGVWDMEHTWWQQIWYSFIFVVCKSSACLQLVAQPQVPLLMDCVVVRATDLWWRGRQFDSRPFHCRVAKVNSAFHPSG